MLARWEKRWYNPLEITENQGQHRTMGTAGFGGSFAPIVQYEKWEIHPVFPHFSYFRLCQNLAPNLLAPLCGVAIEIDSETEPGLRPPARIVSKRNVLIGFMQQKENISDLGVIARSEATWQSVLLF